MSELLQWPCDFDDTTHVARLGESFVPFLNEMLVSEVTVYADAGWALFGFSRGSRMIDFVRRGRSRRGAERVLANREIYWEVWLHDDGAIHRLGPIFQIRKHACVVVIGVDAVRTLSKRWLAGASLESVASCVTFWDRMDTSQPLKPPA